MGATGRRKMGATGLTADQRAALAAAMRCGFLVEERADRKVRDAFYRHCVLRGAPFITVVRRGTKARFKYSNEPTWRPEAGWLILTAEECARAGALLGRALTARGSAACGRESMRAWQCEPSRLIDAATAIAALASAGRALPAEAGR